jgi:hypothetical protein
MHDARRSRQTDVSNLYCARRFSRKKNTSVHGMGSAKAKAMELPILSSPTCSFAHPYSTQGQHNPTQHACLSLQHPMRPLSQLSAFACGHGSPPFSPMAYQLGSERMHLTFCCFSSTSMWFTQPVGGAGFMALAPGTAVASKPCYCKPVSTSKP